MIDPLICKVCDRETYEKESATVAEHAVCFVCSWAIAQQLIARYNAPELSQLQRLRHRETKGPAGFKDTNAPGHVYYIRTDGLVKIGYTTDLQQRMRAYPPSVSVLAVHPGTLEMGEEHPQQFRDSLQKGREWFSTSPELEAHIESVIKQFGKPKAGAYELKRPATQEEKVRAMTKPKRGTQIVANGFSRGV